MIYGPPKIVSLAIDPHEHFVQVPLQLGISAALVDTLFTDLSGKYWTKSIPPEADRFMADIDAALVEKVLNISKRKWIPNIHHYRQADDLGARFEIAKWRVFCHPVRLRDRAAHLNLICSDSATPGHVFAAQYQQQPTVGGSGMLSVDKWRRYDPADKPQFELLIHSWDIGATISGNASVCTAWGLAKNSAGR